MVQPPRPITGPSGTSPDRPVAEPVASNCRLGLRSRSPPTRLATCAGRPGSGARSRIGWIACRSPTQPRRAGRAEPDWSVSASEICHTCMSAEEVRVATRHTTPSETRPYDGGSGGSEVGDLMPRTVASCACLIVPGTGGPEDGPDYTWLYGRAASPGTGGHPPGPAPATTVRAAPRRDPGDAHPAAAAPPGAPDDASDARRGWHRPRQPAAQPPGRRGRKRRRFRVRYVVILLLLWLVYLVAVPVVAWNKVEQGRSSSPAGHVPAEQDGTTYLMVGSDSREGLSKEERKELQHRWRGGRPHRHDHAAAHRRRGPTC